MNFKLKFLEKIFDEKTKRYINNKNNSTEIDNSNHQKDIQDNLKSSNKGKYIVDDTLNFFTNQTENDTNILNTLRDSKDKSSNGSP